MIGIGGAIPTSSRQFSFLDRSEKGLLDYGIAWPIWGDPADRRTWRFPCPDRRDEWRVASGANAECGMRNAECGIGNQFNPCLFRIPHSAFRIPQEWRVETGFPCPGTKRLPGRRAGADNLSQLGFHRIIPSVGVNGRGRFTMGLRRL